MTQDQHNPTPQSSESIDGSSASDAPAKTAKSTGSARAPRRRHTPSRSRQPKEQANDQKDTKATTETQSQQDQQYQQAEQPSQQRPVAVAAPAAVENAPQVGAETGAETTAETATEPTQAAKSGQRASARGRRGGGSRRRGNKAEDVQLVPVVSAEQTATSTSPTLSGELAGGATDTQESPADDLPAPEPLPLDTAILAHLDALAQAAGATGQQEAASGEAPSAPQDETPAQTRRYRFDRPRAQAATSATPPRTERLSGWRATPPTLMTTAPQAPTEAEAETVAVREAPASETEAITGESAPTESAERVEANAPVIAGGSPEATEGSEGSEAPELSEAGEAQADEEEAAGTEAASEDDEHAEHEGAGRRRRRRGRRSVRGQDAETGEIEGDEHHEQQGHAEPSPTAPTAPSSPSGRSRSRAPYAAPETVVTYGHDYDSGNNGNVLATEGFDEPGYSPYTPTPAPRTRASRSGQPAARHQAESEWSMSTAQEHMQEPASPFGAPEPSFARGFGPQSSGVAAPLHEPLPRIRRGERGGEAPPMSANQLGAVLTNSFAQQTDRLLNELRRQQYPPSMTVALPAFPSTERIGVFVDVANLLYSARNQRMSIDFGRLLDFLRGNRRLIRAHAYAPTNPDPHAEQTFLAAVKGVGYRITTKNYKTFASGARKADMDLDLCMDIVRLVDAGALDTVALVSGDSDFLPLLEYCSDHGVRVEVAAFDDAAAMILRQSCDLFINLSQVDEIRA